MPLPVSCVLHADMPCLLTLTLLPATCLLPHAPAGKSSLTSLDLASNSRLGGAGLAAVARLGGLQSLTLDHASHLTDQALLALLGDGEAAPPPLRHLSLAGLIQITGALSCAPFILQSAPPHPYLPLPTYPLTHHLYT